MSVLYETLRESRSDTSHGKIGDRSTASILRSEMQELNAGCQVANSGYIFGLADRREGRDLSHEDRRLKLYDVLD